MNLLLIMHTVMWAFLVLWIHFITSVFDCLTGVEEHQQDPKASVPDPAAVRPGARADGHGLQPESV